MTTGPEPRLLVIGAGVNGSICAALLRQAGVDVTLLARGRRYADVLANGVIIEDQRAHTRTVYRVPVIDRLEPSDLYDYVLVVVRRNQVAALLPTLARNASPNVVFMVNNIAGPDEYIQALGRQRVLLGFVFGAGRREGTVIRALVATSGLMGRMKTPFGEVDGTVTDRLTRLVGIFRRAGLNAAVSRHMPDWQTSHAILLPSLALPLLHHHLDVRALARSEDDMRLMVESMRDAIDVLRAVGYRLIPRSNEVVRWIPKSLLRLLIRAGLPTRLFEMGALWHISQAPDEMLELARELGVLVERAALPVPALRALLQLEAGTSVTG